MPIRNIYLQETISTTVSVNNTPYNGYNTTVLNNDVSLLNQSTLSPTALWSSSTQTNVASTGGKFFVNVSSISTGQTLQLHVIYKDPTSGLTGCIATTSTISATGSYVLDIYPGASMNILLGTTLISSYSSILPRTFVVQLVFSDNTGTKPVTLTVSYCTVL